MKHIKAILLALAVGFSITYPSYASKEDNFSDIVYYKSYDLDQVAGLKDDKNNKIKQVKADDIIPKSIVKAQVIRVVDGDTIKVSVNDKEFKLRMIGVDTPETVHPSKAVEYFGREASDFTKAQLTGAKVYLEKDISQHDRYNRLLRYVWFQLPNDINNPTYEEIRDKMYNGILLRDGYAKASTFPPDVKYSNIFLEIQKQAEKSKKGLWASESIAGTNKKTSSDIGYKDDNNPNHITDDSLNLAPDSLEKFKYPRGARPTIGQVRVCIKSKGRSYKADQTIGPIKGNRKSGVYHMPNQKYYNKISVNNVTWFYDEAEAIRLGYKKSAI